MGPERPYVSSDSWGQYLIKDRKECGNTIFHAIISGQSNARCYRCIDIWGNLQVNVYTYKNYGEY